MKDKKIFWLDDHLDFSTITSIEDLSEGLITPSTLVKNTSFAYDFESGKKLLSSRDKGFELYIIDGDFPQIMEPNQIERVENFLSVFGKGVHRHNRLEGGFRNQYYNAFIEFCLKYLHDKNFVIHSMSLDAKKLSFLLGFPFYAKGRREEAETPKFENRKTFYHNDVTSYTRDNFELVYQFIQQSSRWEQCEDIPNYWELKKTPELLDEWEYGGSRELIMNRLVPLLRED